MRGLPSILKRFIPVSYSSSQNNFICEHSHVKEKPPKGHFFGTRWAHQCAPLNEKLSIIYYTIIVCVKDLFFVTWCYSLMDLYMDFYFGLCRFVLIIFHTICIFFLYYKSKKSCSFLYIYYMYKKQLPIWYSFLLFKWVTTSWTESSESYSMKIGKTSWFKSLLPNEIAPHSVHKNLPASQSYI